MKKVMAHYAGALVAVCVALGIFGIFYGASFENQNITSYLGSIIQNAIEEAANKVEIGTAFDTYMDVPAFQFVTMRQYNSLKEGSTVPISQIVYALDGKGYQRAVKVLHCWNENFEAARTLRISNGSTLHIMRQGIYWLQLYAEDREGRSSSTLLKIYVRPR